MKLKLKVKRVGEMAQHLLHYRRAGFNSPTWQFIMVHNSSNKESYALFQPLQGKGTHVMYTHTCNKYVYSIEILKRFF